MVWSCAVRLCERRDLEKVTEIERSCFDEPYDFSTFSYLLGADPEGFLVAECEGRVVGYAIGQLRSGRGLVISLAVDPRYRGGGVGESILKELLEHFQRKHVKSVELQVDVHNSYAIKLYEKMGFQVKKTMREYYSSGKDAYLMSKILDRS
mgnify:CR=1 FL=1